MNFSSCNSEQEDVVIAERDQSETVGICEGVVISGIEKLQLNSEQEDVVIAEKE